MTTRRGRLRRRTARASPLRPPRCLWHAAPAACPWEARRACAVGLEGAADIRHRHEAPGGGRAQEEPLVCVAPGDEQPAAVGRPTDAAEAAEPREGLARMPAPRGDLEQEHL